ncbi:metallophosphoesterase [Sporosarcina luteola]|uniref:metallophosphoesterase n=1 Tax=Sporosarcina luteola TaxID=582850 RepID=UPI0020402FB6|nr:metallophosphoesterase [Sporosarcina luteola]MCM3745382.1 metallophosphoesterase [Sporosarcina luteola]
MDKFGLIFGATIIIAIYGSANYYIASKIYQWLRLFFPSVNLKLFASVYIFIAFSMILAFLPLPSSVNNLVSWLSAYWMGIFVYLFLFILMVHLIILIGTMVKIIPTPLPQKFHFFAGFIVVLLTSSFVGYGIYNANQIKHVSYDILMKETPLPGGMKVILISDLHLGAVNSEKRLESIVDDINKLEPDIVCIAGDIFNDDYNAIQDPERAMNLLKSITATYGVYGSLGNHDSGKTFGDMITFLERSNIKLLTDEYQIIDERLIVYGRVDPSPIGGFGDIKRKDSTEILASIDTNLPIIVMDHTPTKLEQYGEEIDLVLAGHTHRGQIFPGSLVTNAIFEVDYGHYQKDATSPHVIVTSGVGTWGMPMRVGTNNEIVRIQLR